MNDRQAAMCLAFEAMKREEQMEVLQKEGIYIGKLRAGEGTTLLYQYQTIYVEVIYALHRRKVEAVHCFTDTAVLDRYFASADFDKHLPN